MSRFGQLCCGFFLIAVSSPAFGLAEYHLGGENGNSWETALSLDGAGEYVVTGEDGQVRRVPVATTPFGVGADTLIDFSSTNSIQPRFIDPTVNLALTDVDSDPLTIPLPYTGGHASSTDWCGGFGKEVLFLKKMHDGDPATAMFRRFTQDPALPPGFGTAGAVWVGIIPAPRRRSSTSAPPCR